VRQHLEARGASFFDDIVHGTRLLRTEVEQALAELVSSGLVTSDSFAGLRALLVPAAVRSRTQRRGRAGQILGMESAGRWSVLSPSREPPTGGAESEDVELVARALLRRYGVVFRKIIERETALPPWRDLLRTYRRLEARGDLRGGRFVAGFSGEQYALPEAVESLRSVRRSERKGVLVSLSAGDPLNLVGIVTPGERIPAISSNRVLFKDGVPVARKVGSTVEIISSVESGERWALETALVRRPTPERLRA
jgi:ATP-dependent Lhr-like helicase